MIFFLFWNCLQLTAHLERSLKIARDEIATYTESTISKQKDIANEVQQEPLFLWSSLILHIQYTTMPPIKNRLIRKLLHVHTIVGGAVASWLVRLTPELAVRIQALGGDIVLCSWARHFTLTVPLSTQVYKWVPVNCWGKPNKLRGSDL